MADDNNYERDKLVDVTKPREQNNSAPPSQNQSNIDASRVSAYTLREQQALERLKKKAGVLDQKESRMKSVKTIVAIILIIILLLIAVVFVIIIGKNQAAPEEDTDVRLSVQIDGKGSLSYITDTGDEKLIEIFPGDKLDISAFVRNSNEAMGEGATENVNPPNTFVRFKLLFTLDYEVRDNVLIPELNEKMWYKFNLEDELKYAHGIKEWDGYYYMLGSLPYLQMEQLFSSITINGDLITCEDSNKYGQIQVVVESIEATTNNLTATGIWATAPREWVDRMIKNKD